MSFWTELLGLAFEVKFVDAGGVRTRVLQAGSGEPVIFLHGISGNLEGYIRNVPAYAKEHQVHLIDMLGHGYTDKLKETLTTELLAKHVIAYMDAVGIKKAHIVGLSLGGWTAGWVAAHYPERILTATLIAAAGDPDSAPAKDPKFGEWLRDSTRAGVLNTDKALTRKRLEAVIAKPEDVTDELVDVRYAIYHQPEFIASLDHLLGMTDPETITRWSLTKEVLAKIECETLIIWGEEDTRADSSGKWLREGIKKSKLVIFNHTGHWPPYERADDFNAVAVPFLKNGLANIVEGER